MQYDLVWFIHMLEVEIGFGLQLQDLHCHVLDLF